MPFGDIYENQDHVLRLGRKSNVNCWQEMFKTDCFHFNFLIQTFSPAIESAQLLFYKSVNDFTLRLVSNLLIGLHVIVIVFILCGEKGNILLTIKFS